MGHKEHTSSDLSQHGEVSSVPRFWSFLALLLALGVTGCKSSAPVARGRLPLQHRLEIKRIQEDLEPSEFELAVENRRYLWEAMKGYMTRAFPIAFINRAQGVIESKLLEWNENGVARRAQITVTMRDDDQGVNVVVLRIMPRAAQRYVGSGRAVTYEWELKGSDPDAEAIIGQQIEARYKNIIEGRTAESVPLVTPVPGLSGSVGSVVRPTGNERYFKSGDSESDPEEDGR